MSSAPRTSFRCRATPIAWPWPTRSRAAGHPARHVQSLLSRRARRGAAPLAAATARDLPRGIAAMAYALTTALGILLALAVRRLTPAPSHPHARTIALIAAIGALAGAL